MVIGRLFGPIETCRRQRLLFSLMAWGEWNESTKSFFQWFFFLLILIGNCLVFFFQSQTDDAVHRLAVAGHRVLPAGVGDRGVGGVSGVSGRRGAGDAASDQSDDDAPDDDADDDDAARHHRRPVRRPVPTGRHRPPRRRRRLAARTHRPQHARVHRTRRPTQKRGTNRIPVSKNLS